MTSAAPSSLPVLQGETPESLAEAGVCSLPTARKLLAATLARGQLDPLVPWPVPVPREEGRRVMRERRVGRLAVVAREASAVDPFVKYLYEGEDGARFEAVRIPLERPGRFVVCVSSQVGCALGCTYCATGRLGLTRNLEAWEIVEQVRQIRQELPVGSRVHGVVFQGMGEPLANLPRVVRAIGVLSSPAGLAIDQRTMTVSTAGLPSGIRKLEESGLRVRLGVSLGTARPGRRAALLPIDGQFPLGELVEAIVSFTRSRGYAPLLAVTLISGENVEPKDAHALGALALDVARRAGVAPRVSLVDYNPSGPDDPRRPPDTLELEAFRAVLRGYPVPVVRRYSGARDVGGACGQLTARTPAERVGPPVPAGP